MSRSTKVVMVVMAGLVLLLGGVLLGILLGSDSEVAADLSAGAITTTQTTVVMAGPEPTTAAVATSSSTFTTVTAPTTTSTTTSTTAPTTTSTIVLLVEPSIPEGLMVLEGQTVDLDTGTIYLPSVRGNTIAPEDTDFVLTSILTIVGPPNTTVAVLSPINGATAVEIVASDGCTEVTAGFGVAEVTAVSLDLGSPGPIPCFRTNQGNYSVALFLGPSDPYGEFAIMTAAPPGLPAE